MYPLWSRSNLGRASSVFAVSPGHAVILTAVGFEQYAVQEDSSSVRVAQMACVERIVHEFDKKTWEKAAKRADWIMDLGRRMAEEVSSEAVAVDGCSWSLDMCRNVAVIGLPGTYRLRFNDDSMIGAAQVYADLVGLRDVLPATLFFG